MVAVCRVSLPYRSHFVKTNIISALHVLGDPWLEVTLSATEANTSSTDLRPIYLTDGFHCSDMTYVNAVVEPSLGEVWNQALTTFPRWVSDFNGRQGSSASEVGMSPFRLGMVVASAALVLVTVL